MRSKKLSKTVASFVLVAAMVAPLLLSASPANAAMKFNTKKASLTVGQTKKVKIKGFKKGSTAKWSSSSSKVASITGKGKKATIKAVAPGTAKISCKVGTTTIGGLTVKVRQKVTSFAITGAKDLKAGETCTLVGKINKGDTASKTNQTVSWKSSNTKVASVKKTGSTNAKVTAVSSGSATITATAQDGKSATCTIKVTGKAVASTGDNKNGSSSKTNSKPTSTPWTYSDKSIVYKQHYNVTRWYNPDTTGAINGHKHDGYKNNTFAIWMVGFFDNQYSTNEDEYNTTYGPELDNYKGKVLNISGNFKYDGTNQKTILFQINYTSPSDYPILYKWEQGSNGLDSKYSNELKIKDNNGGSGGKLDAGKTGKLNIDITIPTNAKNGDKDEATGKNYGIYVYFPNKPGGALAYVKDNTFHFSDFCIKTK